MLKIYDINRFTSSLFFLLNLAFIQVHAIFKYTL